MMLTGILVERNARGGMARREWTHGGTEGRNNLQVKGKVF